MDTQGIDKRIKNMTAISNLGEIGLYCLFCKYYGGIEAQKKISYQETGKRTYLDIFREKSGEKKPLFIYIHGGGWVSGLRTSRQFYCKHFAKRGYVAASIGYDYGVDASHPTHLRQIFKGIEYLLDNADKYGIDTEKIVVAGESAGGYFTSMVGAISSHKELYYKLGIDFRYRDTFKVSACVVISGIFDLVGGINSDFKNIDLFMYAFCRKTPEEIKAIKGTEEYNTMVSACYLDEKFPPSFIIGSDKDPLLPEAERAYDSLKKAGTKCEFFLSKGINGVHAGALSCDRGKYGKACAAETEKFLKEVLK